MHSGPLSSLSPTLQTLLTGEMIEAKLQCVDWSDVHENTFIRLCEYAYNRDYTPPSPLQRIDATNAIPEDDSRSSEKINKKKKQRKSSEFHMGSSWEDEVNAEARPEPEPDSRR